MLKSCPYCGGVHPDGYICPAKPVKRYAKKRTYIDRFRSSKAWQDVREAVACRDYHICRVCNDGKYNTFVYNKVEVHHIVPIAEDYNKRLDVDNLITLCPVHHKMSEKGLIPREYLRVLVETPPRLKV